ncbi:MAG TPA: Holliday junction resolvase RuvX [Bacteroidia bacterium]|jgi:putative Holliday junction resolvase|nr:Holliday junction resolvase RuvX [Bacteroidia bacterium]
MKRILAIDYGTKRTGIAVTDTAQIIASGLTTISTQEIFKFINDYLTKEKVECIVVGEPKNLNNTPSEIAAAINDFIKKLKIKHPEMLIYRVDERFTSKMAFQAMIAGGVKKMDRRNKATVDMVSAAIILQSFMEMKKGGNLPTPL